MTSIAPGLLQPFSRTDYGSFIDSRFIELAYQRALWFIEGAGWVTNARLDDSPGSLLASAGYFRAGRSEVLVDLDDGIAQLILHERALVVRVAAATSAGIERMKAAIHEGLPEVSGDDLEVPVRFWWWRSPSPQEMARMLPATPWPDIASNYPEAARRQFEQIASWQRPPTGGRLILFHGPPGTGKTTAVRSLVAEWRAWADFHFITDPEQFLSVPAYLLEALAFRTIGASSASQSERWKIVVLEDAGEYLTPDAKHREGQALSRLLNVCDGVLGQAMRAPTRIGTVGPPIRATNPLGSTRRRDTTRKKIMRARADEPIA